MFAVCIESSHFRGMGHLFRSLSLVEALRAAGVAAKIYLNEHAPALAILRERRIDHEVVPLLESDGAAWEADLVRRDGIRVWVNDRLSTDADHAARIKALGIPLATFDDRGPGAELADLHIAGLALNPEERLAGRLVLRGIRYLILNPEVERFRRVRTAIERVLVTLGGSDTHGVTPRIMEALAGISLPVTVILGPGFQHEAELSERKSHMPFTIKRNVPSMIAEFFDHDIAITGGGITPFEANATGLPCVVVANEDFEIPIGKALENLGSARFLGHHANMSPLLLPENMEIEAMSRAGLASVPSDGARQIVVALLSL